MRKSGIWCISLVTVWAFSCSKDKSIETGGTGGNGGALGTNCKVNSIIAADSLTGEGLFSLFTNFNSSRVATRVEAYDSTSLSLAAAADLTYKGDTIRVGASEYFVTDASKRISRFYTLLDPSDPSSDVYVYNYTYDASGYLKSKTISIASFPLPLAKFDYTWAGGNLVKIEGNTVVLGNSQKILVADLTYDASKTAKNFIQVLPDGFETFLFTMALDIGKKSTNVLKTISLVTYDNGAPANTYHTLIRDVKFSPDGYITEWYAEGDGFDALGVFTGRTLFRYNCN
jgi:hypothetical protein